MLILVFVVVVVVTPYLSLCYFFDLRLVHDFKELPYLAERHKIR